MSTEMIHKGWRVSRLPKPFPREAYDRAREEVIAKAIKNPDVVAVMDFGVEQYPGISDIDFYIIFGQSAKNMFIPLAPGYSDDTEYLMMHTTLLMSEEFFSEIRYLNPWSIYAKERYIYKREGFVPPAIKELPGIDPILSAAFMYDKVESILSTMPSFVNKGLPVRNIFELCKNCIYNIWRLEDLSIAPQQKYQDYIKEFDALRDVWFDLALPEALDRLITLYTKTMEYTFEIAWLLDEWLSSRVEYRDVSSLGLKKTRWPFNSAWDAGAQTLYVHTYKYARLFTDAKLTSRQAMDLSAAAGKNVHVRVKGFVDKKLALTPIILPWRLSAFVTGVIAEQGIIGRSLIQDTFTNAMQVPVLMTDSLKYRIQQQDKLTATYREKRIPGGEGKGYIYGNQIYGYLFGEERGLRRFLVLYVRLHFFKSLSRVFTSKR